MRPDSLDQLPPRYEVTRELGRGGMGRVLLVHDDYLERDVALKLLHSPPEDAAELTQLKREFALLTEIEHPSVARAYDFGYAGDTPYFTSQYIRGRPLSVSDVSSVDEFSIRRVRLPKRSPSCTGAPSCTSTSSRAT